MVKIKGKFDEKCLGIFKHPFNLQSVRNCKHIIIIFVANLVVHVSYLDCDVTIKDRTIDNAIHSYLQVQKPVEA